MTARFPSSPTPTCTAGESLVLGLARSGVAATRMLVDAGAE